MGVQFFLGAPCYNKLMNQKVMPADRQGFTNILVIILVVAVAAVAGYFVLVEKLLAPVITEQPEQQQAVPSVTDDASPSVSPPDATANWKTYRNEEYGFEFEYPNNWYYDVSSD